MQKTKSTAQTDPMEWFMRRVEPDANSGCWLWSGSVDPNGYGLSRPTGTKRATHLSLRLFKGQIRPIGMVAMHSCDTPSCVRPEHLSWGTQSQNLKDAYLRGRASGCPPTLHGEDHANSKISDDDRRDIFKMRSSGMIYREMSEKYGLTIPAIYYICKNDRWNS